MLKKIILLAVIILMLPKLIFAETYFYYRHYVNSNYTSCPGLKEQAYPIHTDIGLHLNEHIGGAVLMLMQLEAKLFNGGKEKSINDNYIGVGLKVFRDLQLILKSGTRNWAYKGAFQNQIIHENYMAIEGRFYLNIEDSK